MPLTDKQTIECALSLLQRDDYKMPPDLRAIFVLPKCPDDYCNTDLEALPCSRIISKMFGIDIGSIRPLLQDIFEVSQKKGIAVAVRAVFVEMVGVSRLTVISQDNPRANPRIAGLLDLLITECGLDRNTKEITISRDGDCHFQRRRGLRFGHTHYATLIGHGEKSTKVLRELEVSIATPHVTSYGGGFLVHKELMEDSAKNGWYELRIRPGNAKNGVCASFRAELHQYLHDGTKLPMIVFPPASGDKNRRVVTDSVIEVPSMAQMMMASALKRPQTPAAVFGLVGIVDDVLMPDPWAA